MTDPSRSGLLKQCATNSKLEQWSQAIPENPKMSSLFCVIVSGADIWSGKLSAGQ
jgi:hypothetical protein